MVIVDHGRVVLAGDVDELRAASPARYVTATFSGALAESWQPPGDVVARGIRTGARAASTLRLTVGRCSTASGVAGSLTSFSFAPPDLSEVFLDAVGPAAATVRPMSERTTPAAGRRSSRQVWLVARREVARPACGRGR